MRKLTTMGLAAIAALALTIFLGAGSASATTLEVGGVTKNESVTISGSLESGTSGTMKNTSGSVLNTCSAGELQGATESPYTGSQIAGSLTAFVFSNCTRAITTHNAGKIYGEHIENTTNGTFYSKEAVVTVSAPLVGYITCTTGEGTHLGTATGVASGHATLHISTVIECGFSAQLQGTATITSPTGLGVSA